MKKMLYVSVIAMLCFAMFSCTQAPETTPNDIETVTPEEIPNEAVTPNDPEVEPEVEPETPAEPEDERFPHIEEVTVKLSDKEITLPAEDENTKKILIPYPSDFIYGYQEPELVSPEDFEWGDYVPFVRYGTGSYGEVGIPVYSYAFLGEDAATVEEGNALYNKLNDKYKKTFNYTPDDRLHYYPLSNEPDAMKLVNESRIIYISTDGKTVGNFYINKGSDYSDTNPVWSSYYELHTEGAPSTLYYSPVCYNYDDGNYIAYYTNAYIHPEFHPYEYNTFPQRYDLHVNTNTVIYYGSDTINIYSLDQNKLIYRIDFDFELDPIGKNYGMVQLLDERYLIMIIYNDYLVEEGGPCHNIYLFNLETEEMTRINNYSYNPLISPDGKYLMYTSAPFSTTEVNSPINWNYKMKYGFYIKNMENGEITYYQPEYTDYGSDAVPLSWIEKDALDNLLS